ncbi:MAG: DUF4419 domain-containing protein, partial [Spirochaetota bacterium]|nr:DUF4419 domain-containing protein [Spirochaetota bacterium]
MTRKSLIENKISGKTISLSSKLKVAKKVLPEQTRKQVIEYYLNGPVESFAYDSQRLIPTDFHPFMATLQQAFIDHRPVIITPDQIWLLICQGISNHIHLNTDKLRHLFTSTSKKTHLKIENNFLIKGK